MVMLPQVSWLFFKAVRAVLAVKRPYLDPYPATRKNQPTGRGPEGCVENGPAAALLVGYVSIQICALLAPCRRPILNATTSPLYARRYTRPFIRLRRDGIEVSAKFSRIDGPAVRSTDLFSRGGRPISTCKIRMDTYGHRLRRLVCPLAMDYLPGPSARLPLLIRAIILRAIYLESIKSIRRQ